MNKNRKRSIEQSTKEIFHKAEVRERAGRDSFNAGWQATLEIMILIESVFRAIGEIIPQEYENFQANDTSVKNPYGHFKIPYSGIRFRPVWGINI
jgi:hypothetical protein